MKIRKGETVMSIFECKRLNGTFSYRMCILRQVIKTPTQALSQNTDHVECIDCHGGLVIAAHFGKQVRVHNFTTKTKANKRRHCHRSTGIKNGCSPYSRHYDAGKAQRSVG